MRILSVTSEMYPLIKTGGLADVIGSLPTALAEIGIDMRVLLPGYPQVKERIGETDGKGTKIELSMGSAVLKKTQVNGITIWILDMPGLFDRETGPYADAEGHDHPDNWKRFAALSQAAVALVADPPDGWVPDIAHSHDWQAGLVPAYFHAAGLKTATVYTIHNIAFPGSFPANIFPELNLPDEFFAMDGLEFHGDVSFLKAGLWYADAITTVSPTYAEELQRPDHGMGFDGVIRAHEKGMTGILNGIDTDEWNPETDQLIERNYSARAIAGRDVNRQALSTAFALDGERALLSVVSRLTEQKGIDLILEAAYALLERDLNLLILGTGDDAIEAMARDVAARNPGRVGLHIGYDEALAHRIQAGTDALLVPSRFEPCGLTQLCALRYGAVPIVAPTGGLVDSVIDANAAALARKVATGIHLREVSLSGIIAGVDRMLDLRSDSKVWQRIKRNAMATDVSWHASAAEYAALYQSLAGGRGRASRKTVQTSRNAI